ncbi:trypsin-1 [Drosophila busckii]|uniref:trypsin-1 n=1 Tax=Drosophila busckii TaxID=30019 RepID=UPI00083EC921|nr:trypsin-1 [Drosophila busckii]
MYTSKLIVYMLCILSSGVATSEMLMSQHSGVVVRRKASSVELRNSSSSSTKATTAAVLLVVEEEEEEDDENFHFLVTGGYRPEDYNALAKYVVSIRIDSPTTFRGDNHRCGGCLITKDVVLTAAHCLHDRSSKLKPRRVKVVAGSPRRLASAREGQELVASKIIPHPQYSKATMANDIGLIRLAHEFTIDSKVGLIPRMDRSPSPGLACTVVGWGSVIQYGPLPDELINANLTVLSDHTCMNIDDGYRPGMICANNPDDFEVDSCQGDSGGPMFCNDKVVGVVSWGQGCGTPNSAGFYSDVYYFKSFIDANVASAQLMPRLQLLLPLLYLLAKYLC